MKYYYLLGLKSDCTQEEIKKSYRKLSIKFHPDKNDGDDFFKERFQDIQEAYEVLSDERKRKAYDESFKFSNQNKKQEPYRELRDPIIEFFKSDKSEIYDQETILFSWKVLYADQIYLSTNKADILKSSGSKSIKISNLRDKEKVEITLTAKNVKTAKEVRSNIWINSKLYADIKEKIKKDEEKIHEEKEKTTTNSNNSEKGTKTDEIKRVKGKSVKKILFTILVLFIGSVLSMSGKKMLKLLNIKQERRANVISREENNINGSASSSIGKLNSQMDESYETVKMDDEFLNTIWKGYFEKYGSYEDFKEDMGDESFRKTVHSAYFKDYGTYDEFQRDLGIINHGTGATQITSIELLESEYDFGKIEQGATVNHSFRIKNNGLVPLIIMDTKATCGCIVPKKPEYPIKPGETSQIDVEFNSNSKIGEQIKQITITANTYPPQSFIRIRSFVIENNSSQEDEVNQNPNNIEQNPETFISKFLDQINSKEFALAYLGQNNPKWEPYTKFKSDTGWGGFSKIYDITTSKLSSFGSKFGDAVIRVKYIANHIDSLYPQKYEWDFHLIKSNNSWLITKMTFPQLIKANEEYSVETELINNFVTLLNQGDFSLAYYYMSNKSRQRPYSKFYQYWSNYSKLEIDKITDISLNNLDSIKSYEIDMIMENPKIKIKLNEKGKFKIKIVHQDSKLRIDDFYK